MIIKQNNFINWDKTLPNILSRMKQLASTLKEYAIVLAMRGVGEILAPRIIAEIGNVTRFHSASALCFFVLHKMPLALRINP